MHAEAAANGGFYQRIMGTGAQYTNALCSGASVGYGSNYLNMPK